MTTAECEVCGVLCKPWFVVRKPKPSITFADALAGLCAVVERVLVCRDDVCVFRAKYTDYPGSVPR